jgi:hypothetical protein
MMYGTSLFMIGSLAGVAILTCFPHYQANPAYVRSVTSLAVLRELQNATLTDEIVVTPSGKAGISYVTLGAKASARSTLEGLPIDVNTILSYRLTTKSQCFELEAGCLELKAKSVRKQISIRMPL